jgi:hypothetical protein
MLEIFRSLPTRQRARVRLQAAHAIANAVDMHIGREGGAVVVHRDSLHAENVHSLN